MNLQLFSASSSQAKTVDLSAPLAERMRPRSFDEFYGQEEVLAPGKPLRLLVENGNVPSMILWGPPGCGKTTLAKMIAAYTQAIFVEISAVAAGVTDLRKIVKEAEELKGMTQEKTILFVDEIHRFNKAQQDFLLPYVERGTVVLIGATTENPSFEVNNALLSRARVFVLAKLDEQAVVRILMSAMEDKERGLGKTNVRVLPEALQSIAALVDGDARQALNALETALRLPLKDHTITPETIKDVFQRHQLVYDKHGEEHYNIISALHKSMRGSDANAALYWLGRMLEAGEDPLYVARRLVRFASEDVGMADPQALVQAVSAFQAAHMIGMPECNVILSQAVVYLSKAPKSNALYVAYGEVAHDIKESPNDPVPLHIRNAPTKLMKDLNYGKGYIYPPSVKGPVKQDYLPDRLKGKRYWNP